jgi:hypothetical protein
MPNLLSTTTRLEWTIEKSSFLACEPGTGNLDAFSPLQKMQMVEELRSQWYGWIDETVPRLQRVLVLSRR